MSKDLIVRDEVFPYPVEGDNNYGEAATDWATSVSDVLLDVSGPGDISPTEITLVGTSDGTYTTGTITNFTFDTSYVQRITATGYIRRNYSDNSYIIESFKIEGIFNGSEIDFYPEFSSPDTNFDFTVNVGQFGFSYLDDDGSGKTTSNVTVKFQANAIVDESFFED